MKKFLILFFMLPFYPLLSGTDSLMTDTDKVFEINIISNVSDAQIFIDTLYAGKTPLLNYKLREGLYSIKLINPGHKAGWRNDNAGLKLSLIKDTTLSINFRFYYSFNSDPFNAEIIKDDTVFGITPFRIFTGKEVTGSILFRKKNYSDLIFDMKNYSFETGARVTLLPLKTNKINFTDNYAFKNKSTQFNKGRNLFAVIGLGAAAITGGVFALKFKNNANSDYDDYLATGSDASLNESNTNDKGFIISLVLMQMAVGGLIYFLFFD